MTFTWHDAQTRVAATARNYLVLIESAVRQLSDGTPRSRLIVCALAVAILFARLPRTFLSPEFWAEDALLINSAYNQGWPSLFKPIGEIYFNLYGSLVALAAVQGPPILWPVVTTYAAFGAAILVVFMVTSPRLGLPYKAVAALAVVATPLQDNVFGGLANAQWILPVGLFALAFSSRHRSPVILLAEIAFAVVVGLDGPLGSFLVPVFAWRALQADKAERGRLLILTAVLAACAVIQAASITANLRVLDLAQPAPYNQVIWITMPLRWIEALRLAGIFGASIVGAVLVVAGAAAIFLFAFRSPHRDLKLAMIFFSAAILYSGMYKMRHFLYLFANDRYAYVGSVFFFWFLCLLADRAVGMRRLLVCGFAVLLLITSTARRIDEGRPQATTPWSSAIHAIGRGPVVIPIAPSDVWFVRLER